MTMDIFIAHTPLKQLRLNAGNFMQTNPSLPGWIQRFIPHTVTVSHRERLRASIGALLGLAAAGLLIHVLPGYRITLPLLAAPMGASAVLVFAVPSSPLAQPWSVIGGNIVGASVGVTAALLVPEPALAGAIAVALTIALMFALRCVHPPSGAVALTAVFGGPAICSLGYHFVFAPIALQSLLLVGLALTFHTVTGHRYPHASHPARDHQAASSARPENGGFARHDLETVRQRRGEMLDIDLDDLEGLLRETQLQACSRGFNGMRCADIMSAPAITVTTAVSTLSALRLLRRHAVKALPVVDEKMRIQGIVTRADLVPHAYSGRALALGDATIHWLRRKGRATQSVGKVMTRDVCCTRTNAAITDLVPLFAHSGHHHIPVTDDDGKVTGMITESDVIAGLYTHSAELESNAA